MKPEQKEAKDYALGNGGMNLILLRKEGGQLMITQMECWLNVKDLKRE